MATYTIIKLKDMSPLHMGTGKENYDFSASQLQSDTLSAALASIRVQQGRKDDIADFLDSFSLSSAFPYYAEYYFLPRPLGKINVCIDDCEEYTSRKKLKTIRFIEQSLWNELISGKEVHIQSYQLKDGFLLPVSNESFKKPYKSIIHQRVAVPRVDEQDAEPFFFDWTFFDKEAGLYCLTDAQGKLLDELIHLFEILGENGIGTDKNIGGGKFIVDKASISLPDEKSDTYMLLSLYIPQEEEMNTLDLENSRFELIQRGGYMAGSMENDFWHLRKKSIYMFQSGSILKTSQLLQGKIVNLCPTNYNDNRMHPVYRSGKSLTVPIIID